MSAKLVSKLINLSRLRCVNNYKKFKIFYFDFLLMGINAFQLLRALLA